MIVHHEITQGTAEWHQLKYRKVGGSTSKGLFVASDTLLLELLAEHTEPFQLEEDCYISPAMQRGIDLEPLHRSEIEKYIGCKLLSPGWLQCEDIPLLGISPDGISEDLTISWEGKCPGAKKHIETAYCKQIPSDNIHQCLHYFTVNPLLERHYFSSFRPESEYPLIPFVITRETLIDLGWTKKEPGFDKNGKACVRAVPDVKTVANWVQVAKGAALELEANIEVALINLRRI